MVDIARLSADGSRRLCRQQFPSLPSARRQQPRSGYALQAQRGETLAYNSLHRVELRNALRNAQAFGQITETERRLAFRQIEQDYKPGC